MSPFLACFDCTARMLVLDAPFLVCWGMAFLVWALVAGIPLVVAAERTGTPLAPHPFSLLVRAILFGVPLSPVVGTLGVACLLGPIWLFRLVRPPALADGAKPDDGSPSVARAARMVNRAFAIACVLLVPLAYARVKLQRIYGDALPGVFLFE